MENNEKITTADVLEAKNLIDKELDRLLAEPKLVADVILTAMNCDDSKMRMLAIITAAALNARVAENRHAEQEGKGGGSC
jgi:hypothetical protein